MNERDPHKRFNMSIFSEKKTGKNEKVTVNLPESAVDTLKALAEQQGKTVDQLIASMADKSKGELKEELPVKLLIQLNMQEAFLLKALGKLHGNGVTGTRVLLHESFKAQPDFWKKLEKDALAMGEKAFFAGKGKTSKDMLAYYKSLKKQGRAASKK